MRWISNASDPFPDISIHAPGPLYQWEKALHKSETAPQTLYLLQNLPSARPSEQEERTDTKTSPPLRAGQASQVFSANKYMLIGLYKDFKSWYGMLFQEKDLQLSPHLRLDFCLLTRAPPLRWVNLFQPTVGVESIPFISRFENAGVNKKPQKFIFEYWVFHKNLI